MHEFFEMKVCPFCFEEVRDEAIKCRYCSSSLLPVQPGDKAPTANVPADSNQVVYVVDKGLITFAKFALATLAIFITAGAILFGFNVKETGDKVRDTYEKVRDSQEKIGVKIQELDTRVQNAKDTIDAQVKGVEATARQVADARAGIEADQKRIEELLSKSEQESQQIHVVFLQHTAGANPTIRPHPYLVNKIAELYDFPTEVDGKGQVVALIELGGGYRDADLDAFFREMKIQKPDISWVSVDGATNKAGDITDFQVTLDIEVVAVVAPGARVVVYFAPNTNQGFISALTKAIHDDKNRPSVISISWGSSESNWATAGMNQMNAILQQAALRGVTVVVAAGDNGVTDGVKDGKPHVDFPASSPYVLAVGGTRLIESGDEVVWNDGTGATGGGVSDFFPRPDWQAQVNVPARSNSTSGRGIPDVAANADPASGYQVYVHGSWQTVGGTASATPLWAGLIALLNQGVGRNLGYINPVLYKTVGPGQAFHSITQGDNGIDGVKGYPAGPGWNASTGWGSPNGRKLLAAFKSYFASAR